MKVILRTDVKLGSGTITDAYVPIGGGEYASDQAYAEALKRLFDEDVKTYGDQVEEAVYFDDGESAHVFAGDYSIYYETIEIREV
jgi:hypothetical protein